MVYRLLIAVASLFAEHRFQGVWTSVVVGHRLRCSVACGICVDQGSDPCPPTMADGFLSTLPPGKSSSQVFGVASEIEKPTQTS